MSPEAIIAVGIGAAFLAGVAHGLTGFGSSIVFVSIMVLFLPPLMVVPVAALLALCVNALVLAQTWRRVDLRRIWPLMLSGVAGLPFGAWLLTSLDADALKAFIGAVITAFAIVMLTGYSRPIRGEKRAFVIVGLLSGLLNAGAGMSGPPVILFFTNQNLPKNVFRANIVIYFLVVNAFSISVFAHKGLVTGGVLRYAGLFLAALAAGGALGIWLNRRLDEKLFRNLALLLVTVAGAMAVASGLRALL